MIDQSASETRGEAMSPHELATLSEQGFERRSYSQLSNRSDNLRLTASATQMDSIAVNLGANAVLAGSTTAASSSNFLSIQACLAASGNAMQSTIRNFASDSTGQAIIENSFSSATVLAASVGEAAAIAAIVRAAGYVNRASVNLVAASAQAPAPLIYA